MNLVSADKISDIVGLLIVAGIKMQIREACQVLFAQQKKLVKFYCVELFKFSASHYAVGFQVDATRGSCKSRSITA